MNSSSTPLPDITTSSAEHNPDSSALTMAQPLRQEDMQPTFKNVTNPIPKDTSPHRWYVGFLHCVGSAIGAIGALPGCFCLPSQYRPVEQGNVGLVYEFGRFDHMVDPGLVKVNPVTQKLVKCNVKEQRKPIVQKVMTKDNLRLTFTAVVYYCVASPPTDLNTADIEKSFFEHAEDTIHRAIVALDVEYIIRNSRDIATFICEQLKGPSTKWGINVIAILITNLACPDHEARLSKKARDNANLEAAKNDAEAKLIAAKADAEAKLFAAKADAETKLIDAKAGSEAAKVLSEGGAVAVIVRGLESKEKIAQTANSKVIYMPGPDIAQSELAQFDDVGEGPSKYVKGGVAECGTQDTGIDKASKGAVVDNV